MPKTPVLMITAALLTVSPAFAQNATTTYPSRAIKIIVGFAAGGGTDIVARLVAQKMQESFGQSVFVENRPGGNSMLGPDIAAKSAPDGYTLLFAATGQMAVSPADLSENSLSAAQGLRAGVDGIELSADHDRERASIPRPP